VDDHRAFGGEGLYAGVLLTAGAVLVIEGSAGDVEVLIGALVGFDVRLASSGSLLALLDDGTGAAVHPPMAARDTMIGNDTATSDQHRAFGRDPEAFTPREGVPQLGTGRQQGLRRSTVRRHGSRAHSLVK
ncbi:unnamed protein product, partial [Pylaiella littoralis]